MRAKEVWEARWRVLILNPIGWLLAASFPFLFQLIRHGHKPIPSAVAPFLHYPNMAFGWFGEDLPELLLVYVIVWAVAQITREWQTGSIEFLGQLPLTRSQVAWAKGIWGSAEIAVAAVLSTAALWIASMLGGHPVSFAALMLSGLVMAMGFIAILWMVSAFAWAIHSTYAIILIALGLYVASVAVRAVAAWRRFSPLTYIGNTNPQANFVALWERLGILAVAAAILAWVALGVAARQEFVSNHGRDQW